MTRRRRGFTMTEVVVTILILGILAAPIALLTRRFFRSTLRFERRLRAERHLTGFLATLRRDLRDMNFIVGVTTGAAPAITFLMDSHRLPGYDPAAFGPGAPLPNEANPDRDGDENALPTAVGDIWQFGNDRDDDDDDGDGRLDVQCRYRLVNGEIRRQMWYNEVAEPTEQTLAVNVSSFSLTYFATVASRPTWDTGPIDAQVDALEIAAQTGAPPWGPASNPPANWGTGAVAAAQRARDAVEIIRVHVAIDVNQDGEDDARAHFEIDPEMLPLKRKFS